MGNIFAVDRAPGDPGAETRDFAELVLTQVRTRPGAIAATGPDGDLSYAQLGEVSSRVAAALIGSGVRPGDVVGVCLGQSRLLPAVLLGVARARAAYLPLDLANPVQRLEFQVADAGVGVVLAADAGLAVAAEVAARLGDGIRLLDVQALPEGTGAGLDAPADPEDLAYVIYTSGSSGRPKGVEVTRGNLAVHLDAIARTFPITPADVMTTIAGVSFDITHLGIWGPLSSGARCLLAEKSAFVDGHLLAMALTTHAVTILQATPTSLRTLVAGGWTGAPHLRVMSGGEALDTALAAELLPRAAELWNFYGPTEATIWATALRVRSTGAEAISIGRPLPRYRAYVIDADGRRAPAGGAGELWLAGPGVARGYRGRPELTAEAFGEDPFAPGERRYRTGDRARWLADGTLEFLGRTDHQVKLRGYRVELGEIEDRLRAHPAVADAVVEVAGKDADAHLVAYVVGRAGAEEQALRTDLLESLPEYMVPHRWVSLAALPTLPSGKVDRSALPPADADEAEPAAADPLTPTEEFLARTWAEVLKLPGVGKTDNFFELGGHSFAATLTVAKIRTALGCRIPVRVLFDHPALTDFVLEVENALLQQLARDSAPGRSR